MLNRVPEAMPLIGVCQQTTQAGLALNSAFTFGSGGQGWSIRFTSPVSADLDKVYWFITARTGTPGNLTCELRNMAGRMFPGSTVHASTTVAPPASAGQWIEATFGSPFTLTRGQTYFVLLFDPAADASNFSTVCARGSIDISASHGASQGQNAWHGIWTGDGFQTSSNHSGTAVAVLAFSDGSVMGHPYTTRADHPNSTVYRGLRIDPLDHALHVGGLFEVTSAPASDLSEVRIFLGDAGPGTTPEQTLSFDADIGFVYFDFELPANTGARIVLVPSANSVHPRIHRIQDYARFAAVQNARLAGGKIYGTVQDGSSWADNPDDLPAMALALQTLPGNGNGGGTNQIIRTAGFFSQGF